MVVQKNKFYCDHCGSIIEDTSQGQVEYEMKGKYFRDFRIVHKHEFSPYKRNEAGCLKYNWTMDLTNYINANGDLRLNNILYFLYQDFLYKEKSDMAMQPEDMKNFVDFVKRLSVPDYEEARRYFNDSDCKEYMSGENPEIINYAKVVKIGQGNE